MKNDIHALMTRIAESKAFNEIKKTCKPLTISHADGHIIVSEVTTEETVGLLRLNRDFNDLKNQYMYKLHFNFYRLLEDLLNQKDEEEI